MRCKKWIVYYKLIIKNSINKKNKNKKQKKTKKRVNSCVYPKEIKIKK